MPVNEFNTYVEGVTPDAEGNSRWEVGAFQTAVRTSEVKPMVSSKDSVKEASISIADRDWSLIRRSVPNNYPLLLRDTTAPMFAEWLKDKAPWRELVVLGGETEFPDEGGLLELSLANSFLDALRGVTPEGSPVHAVVRVKRYGVHMIEVKVDCQKVQAESACAELVFEIGGHWPEAVRRLRAQIDEEVHRNWSELDRELTLRLIGDEDGDTLGREVRDWLNSHAVGVRWVIENLETTVRRDIEVRLWGEEGAIWRTACGMAERWPALAPEVAAKLVERTQGDLEERLSRDARRYLRDWLDEHSPEAVPSTGTSTTRESEAERVPIRDESQEGETPWEQIPDHRYYRKMVEYWWARYTAEEIGRILDREPGTIRNRLTLLRHEYGEEVVPYKRPPDRS
jgi:hypothetical protein